MLLLLLLLLLLLEIRSHCKIEMLNLVLKLEQVNKEIMDVSKNILNKELPQFFINAQKDRLKFLLKKQKSLEKEDVDLVREQLCDDIQANQEEEDKLSSS